MIRILSGLRSVTDPDGAILLDIPSGRFFRVNRVGSQILSLLQAGNSAREIIEKLSAAQIDRRTLEADVQSFFVALEARGLAHEAPDQEKEG
jgi:hypothetical protein